MTNEEQNELNTTTIATTGADSNTHHYDHFYQDPTFWIGVSFTLVVVFLAKPIFKAVYSILGNKVNMIKNNIKESKQLEIDARKLLEEYKQKVVSLEDEIKTILNKSKKEIDFMRYKSIKILEEELKQRKEYNEHFLINMQKQAKKEINDLISDNVISFIKISAQETLDAKAHDELIDASIENIKKLSKN